MNKRASQGLAILFLLVSPIHADVDSRRATITGGGGPGRCTIEVNVDGAARVAVSGDTATLTTLSGRPAYWRRFQCNAPLPGFPRDLRLTRTAGRGAVGLMRDPRGVALIQISDPRPGPRDYAIDLQWGRSGGGGWMPGPTFPPTGPGPDPEPLPMRRAVRVCQDSVTDRLNRDGYPYVTFERTIPGDAPGRSVSVSGTVTGKRAYAATRFTFYCSVEVNSWRIRSLDIRPR